MSGRGAEQTDSEAARRPPPLPFSEAPGTFVVTITPAHTHRQVSIELGEGATWDDYASAVEKAADVKLGPNAGEWLLTRNRKVES